MSPNAASLTTFRAGKRATRSVDPCPECGGVERHKGRKADWRVTEPEPAQAGEALSVCYATFEPIIPAYVVKRLEDDFRRGQWLLEVYRDGTLKKCAGAVMGNAVYAWRMENRINSIFAEEKWAKEHTLFLTLTAPYRKTYAGRLESWERMRKNVTKFLRVLKAQGLKKYFVVFEAFKDGGAHCHLVGRFGKRLPLFSLKNKIRLADCTLRQTIKGNWAGHVEITGLKDEGAKRYLQKYLGKFSHIEDSLRRAKRNWEKPEDKKSYATDVKKLWTIYYCKKLKIRRFRSSEKMGITEQAVRTADLIKEMNNSTSERRELPVKVFRLTRFVTFNPAFVPFGNSCLVGSREYEFLTQWVKQRGG